MTTRGAELALYLLYVGSTSCLYSETRTFSSSQLYEGPGLRSRAVPGREARACVARGSARGTGKVTGPMTRAAACTWTGITMAADAAGRARSTRAAGKGAHCRVVSRPLGEREAHGTVHVRADTAVTDDSATRGPGRLLSIPPSPGCGRRAREGAGRRRRRHGRELGPTMPLQRLLPRQLPCPRPHPLNIDGRREREALGRPSRQRHDRSPAAPSTSHRVRARAPRLRSLQGR